MGATNAFPNFSSAASAALDHLQERFGMGLWMVTRTVGDDWIVLEAADRGYGIEPGNVMRWSDSFCSRMVAGEGPRVASDSATVRAYAEAPIGRTVQIGAYVGVPLLDSAGGLFGTLCAIDPDPQPATLVEAEAEIELFARLLSSVLAGELRADALAREAERAAMLAARDELTGVGNRRLWDELLGAEESRCMRFGHSAAVIVVDLDGLKQVNDSAGHAAGDELLRRAAETLRRTVRPADAVARLGGDEFAVLAVECPPAEAHRLAGRLRQALRVAGAPASVGWASRDPREGLAAAVGTADLQMYAEKRERAAFAA